jgi:hypothetical protein
MGTCLRHRLGLTTVGLSAVLCCGNTHRCTTHLHDLLSITTSMGQCSSCQADVEQQLLALTCHVLLHVGADSFADRRIKAIRSAIRGRNPLFRPRLPAVSEPACQATQWLRCCWVAEAA